MKEYVTTEKRMTKIRKNEKREKSWRKQNKAIIDKKEKKMKRICKKETHKRQKITRSKME